ncbi:hypothetical protein QCA50_004306 [Cerrena zonata]|uniref:SAP domain-containing protein n=1 Tax=Cerrena zonata TaxID=2478898 RepID=A0AAW0GR23_9APHY
MIPSRAARANPKFPPTTSPLLYTTMDASLKALKVVELKDILQTAKLSLSGKQNKADLISKILASPQAIETYNAKYKPNVAVPPSQPAQQPEPVPAESVTTVDDRSQTEETLPEPTPAKITPQPATSAPTPATSTTTTTDVTAQPTPGSTTPTGPTPEDIELEKRKARAARFGIPLVEPKSAPAKRAAKPAGRTVDPEKLAARAARFGMPAPESTATPVTKTAPTKPSGRNNKRAAPPVEEADAEELERRRKRAERFGMGPAKVAAVS